MICGCLFSFIDGFKLNCDLHRCRLIQKTVYKHVNIMSENGSPIASRKSLITAINSCVTLVFVFTIIVRIISWSFKGFVKFKFKTKFIQINASISTDILICQSAEDVSVICITGRKCLVSSPLLCSVVLHFSSPELNH